MAYSKVSKDYLKTIYHQTGKAVRNKLKIKFNGIELENADRFCERITKSGRIIPYGNRGFSLDKFVSQEMECIFHDIDVNIIKSPVEISIGTLVNDVYEYVPLGIYNIQDKPITDKNKITIKLLDTATKFDFNYNGKDLIDLNGGKAKKGQIFEDICSKAGVKTKITYFDGWNDEIGTYDNSIKARKYISFLAEQCGAFPTMDRNGELIFVYLNKLVTHRIPLSIVQRYDIGDKYEISRVVFEDGVRKFESGSTADDTLFINASNPYINSQEQINKIYDNVSGFKINSCDIGQVYGNPTIDSYDLIEIYDDNPNKFVNKVILRTFATFNFEYKGLMNVTYQTTIEEGDKTENTSFKNSPEFIKKYVKSEIDQINGELKLQAGQINSIKDGYIVKKTVKGTYIFVKDAGKHVPETFIIKGNPNGLTGPIKISINTETFKHELLTEDNKIVLSEDGEPIIVFGKGNNDLVYNIEEELYALGDVVDTLDIVNGIITKRVKKNPDGSLIALDKPEIIEVDKLLFTLFEGENKIQVLSKNQPQEIEMSYLTSNSLNKTFATKSELKITKDSIEATVSEQKVIIDDELSKTNSELSNAKTDLQNQISSNKDKFNDYATNDDVKIVKNEVSSIQTSLKKQISVTEEILQNGVSKVSNTSGTFDKDGLTIEKTGAETKGKFNEKGVSVVDASGMSDNDLLYAGYVDEEKAKQNPILKPFIGQTVVFANNLIVSKYLIEGTHSRVQDYKSGTGVFIL